MVSEHNEQRHDRDEPHDWRNRTDPRDVKHVGEGIIGASRFIIVLAILGTGLSAAAMMVYGAVVVLKTIWTTFEDAGSISKGRSIWLSS